MDNIKRIRTKEDYEAALRSIEVLMAGDPDPDSDEGEKLSILATLIRDYESQSFPETLPDAVEAIKFRMEQSNLKAADLIPFMGSRSRVSEILSGKRKLTVDMMRALEAGLGIPARVLLKEPSVNEESVFTGWGNDLLKEMHKRGYFGKRSLANSDSRDLLKQFFSGIGSPLQLQGILRQSSYRSAPATDKRALAAWTAQVLHKASKVRIPVKFKSGTVNLAFMQKVAKLSIEKDGPLVVQKHLADHGIILMIEPLLAKTRLDGAVLLMNKANPIIGLTLRHDRLDNFWFTLMHELAHIALHLNQEISLFYDELEDVKGVDIGKNEREADSLAGEALVPASKWEVSPARLIPSFMAADSLAKELGVHIAVVAGRIRHEGGKYFYLNNVVGQAKVRKYFGAEN